MTSRTTTDGGPRGTSIFVRTWAPTAARRARILLVHGIAEHSGRYERTGRLLAAAGFDVHAFDLPGFGQSHGRRAYVERWDDYLEATAAQLRALRGVGDLPVVLLGHSMGALIALTYVLGAEPANRPLPDLLVLSSPPLGQPPLPAALRLAAPLLARLVPTLELSNGLRRDQLSRDPRVGERYAADPLVHARSTTRLAGELFRTMAATERELAGCASMPVPTLVLHGSDDRIASPSNSESMRRIAGCDYRRLEGLRHEIFNEPESAEVVAQLVAWIRTKLDEVSPGAAPSVSTAADG